MVCKKLARKFTALLLVVVITLQTISPAAIAFAQDAAASVPTTVIQAGNAGELIAGGVDNPGFLDIVNYNDGCFDFSMLPDLSCLGICTYVDVRKVLGIPVSFRFKGKLVPGLKFKYNEPVAVVETSCQSGHSFTSKISEVFTKIMGVKKGGRCKEAVEDEHGKRNKHFFETRVLTPGQISRHFVNDFSDFHKAPLSMMCGINGRFGSDLDNISGLIFRNKGSELVFKEIFKATAQPKLFYEISVFSFFPPLGTLIDQILAAVQFAKFILWLLSLDLMQIIKMAADLAGMGWVIKLLNFFEAVQYMRGAYTVVYGMLSGNIIKIMAAIDKSDELGSAETIFGNIDAKFKALGKSMDQVMGKFNTLIDPMRKKLNEWKTKFNEKWSKLKKGAQQEAQDLKVELGISEDAEGNKDGIFDPVSDVFGTLFSFASSAVSETKAGVNAVGDSLSAGLDNAAGGLGFDNMNNGSGSTHALDTGFIQNYQKRVGPQKLFGGVMEKMGATNVEGLMEKLNLGGLLSEFDLGDGLRTPAGNPYEVPFDEKGNWIGYVSELDGGPFRFWHNGNPFNTLSTLASQFLSVVPFAWTLGCQGETSGVTKVVGDVSWLHELLGCRGSWPLYPLSGYVNNEEFLDSAAWASYRALKTAMNYDAIYNEEEKVHSFSLVYPHRSACYPIGTDDNSWKNPEGEDKLQSVAVSAAAGSIVGSGIAGTAVNAIANSDPMDEMKGQAAVFNYWKQTSCCLIDCRAGMSSMSGVVAMAPAKGWIYRSKDDGGRREQIGGVYVKMPAGLGFAQKLMEQILGVLVLELQEQVVNMLPKE